MKKTVVMLLASSLALSASPALRTVEAAPQYGLPKTGQIPVYHQPSLPYDLGDDGANQAGFPLSGPRFTDNGNGTVTDNATGLIWQQNDSGSQAFGIYGGPMTWSQAFSYIGAMNSQGYGGRTDWRVPNILELMSIIDYGLIYPSIDTAYFPTTREDPYWTSTSFPRDPWNEKWALHFRGGFAQFEYTPEGNNFFVRAVAGGRVDVGSTWGLPVTGQTVSYHAGDDGAVQAGYPLSGERFILNADGTVGDRATGLSWQCEDSVSHRLPEYPLGVLNWEDAFGYVKQLNVNHHCGHSDWRVPNIKELASVANYSRWEYDGSSFWSIFTSGVATHYWSSTTYAWNPYSTNQAYWVDFINGLFEIWNATKNTAYYVKAVRGPDEPVPTPTPIANLRFYLDSGDYNGDGTSDISLFRDSAGLWAVRGITRVYFGASADIPVSGDYDGDGTTDIGIYRGTSGVWAIRGITRVYFGSSSDLPVPGDYTGNGRCDMGIFRPGSGLWAIREATRVYYGSSSDQPVPSYYEGGRTKNLGIFRPSTGLWAIRNVSRHYLGAPGDIPLPADYNGDGASSPGIFRKSEGLWAIKSITRVYFGGSSDQPVPANYEGKDASTIAVFRETSGLWALRGVSRVYFGSNEDIPVAARPCNPVTPTPTPSATPTPTPTAAPILTPTPTPTPPATSTPLPTATPTPTPDATPASPTPPPP